jgi:curved DNA-binding protein
MDYYNTLGVGRDASPEEIKQAYRKLASVHHPDKGGDTAKFQEIQQAYETLSDPNKRQDYDMPQHHMGGFSGFPGGGFSFHSGGINIDEIFGHMFGQGFAQRQPQHPTYKTVIHVTLEEVLNGAEKVLQFQTHTGNQVIKIDIPQGIDNGASLRYDNLIKDTVLIVEFRVHNHSVYERRGLDLYSTVQVSVLDLIVGTTLDFVTLSGKRFDVAVKPQTQPNATLRITGQGLTKNYQTGDQYILLKPFIPDTIHIEIKEAIIRNRRQP